MQQIMSLSHSKTNETILQVVTKNLKQEYKILDLGCGQGYFTSLLYERIKRMDLNPDSMIHACDLQPKEYLFDKIPCMYGDFNKQLPYPDNYFDIVCNIEVIEHIEDQFKYITEIHRILKPGGMVYITTPNILNINARISYLGYGMYPLFDILPVEGDVASVFGHINPISYYYLSFILRRNNFTNIKCHYDRRKKSAIGYLILAYPVVLLLDSLRNMKRRNEDKELYDQNRPYIEEINSLDMLLSRSIIVESQK